MVSSTNHKQKKGGSHQTKPSPSQMARPRRAAETAWPPAKNTRYDPKKVRLGSMFALSWRDEQNTTRSEEQQKQLASCLARTARFDSKLIEQEYSIYCLREKSNALFESQRLDKQRVWSRSQREACIARFVTLQQTESRFRPPDRTNEAREMVPLAQPNELRGWFNKFAPPDLPRI
mmetsp:Transcript_14768/g.24618  ORF Transcript_14768/g.24618 Transcript_14768/m.24618 type:complete len:176 (-) Transcript_14768:188-715(-)